MRTLGSGALNARVRAGAGGVIHRDKAWPHKVLVRAMWRMEVQKPSLGSYSSLQAVGWCPGVRWIPLGACQEYMFD